MIKYALLLRLNPTRWPTWARQVVSHLHAKVWFKTGRRRTDDIHPGIPVVVLGTNGLGLVACGETLTGIEFLPDPDWRDVAPEFQQECREPENRVCVKIKRVSVSLGDLQKQPLIANLHRKARETTTWLKSEQYQTLMSLIQKHSA